MKLEKIAEQLDKMQTKLFLNDALTTNEAIWIVWPLQRTRERLEKKIRNKNKNSTREGDEDLQMVPTE
jgi:hypothetical protein